MQLFKLLLSLSTLYFGLFFPLACASGPGEEWHTFTLDNDIFVGEDNGYTNGLFYSNYLIDQSGRSKPESFLLEPLKWTLPDKPFEATIDMYTIGQSMITPLDINDPMPDESDVPYSGLLYFNRSFLTITNGTADRISTTVGVVGPLSGAEVTQNYFHGLFNSDEAMGWDHQLKNEIVFQFSRGRAWRTWVSSGNDSDFISSAQLEVGTLSSSLSGTLLWRYGRQMERSFPAVLLTSDRATNPVAVEGGWFVYAGAELSYIHNIIFADGNTFVDSPSIDYDPVELGVMVGLAYSWQDFSVTLSINDLNILGINDSSEITKLTRYGSLTFVWRG